LSLWDWAVVAYEQPDVAPACLALQDEHGQNVCYLLWALWAAPNDAALRSGAGPAREWEQVVLKPLRGVRRRLPAGELRDDVKALELKAERSLLTSLEGLAQRSSGDSLDVLTRAVAIWGKPAAPEALQRLAAAVSGNQTGR